MFLRQHKKVKGPDIITTEKVLRPQRSSGGGYIKLAEEDVGSWYYYDLKSIKAPKKYWWRVH